MSNYTSFTTSGRTSISDIVSTDLESMQMIAQRVIDLDNSIAQINNSDDDILPSGIHKRTGGSISIPDIVEDTDTVSVSLDTRKLNQLLRNSVRSFIDEHTTFSLVDAIAAKYAVLNGERIIDTLSCHLDKKFEIILGDKTISVLLRSSSIPHLLSFVSESESKTANTRFYLEVTDEMNNDSSITYLEAIARVLSNHDSEIVNTFVNSDNSGLGIKKDNFFKIGIKIAAFLSLFNNIRLQNLNSNLTIYYRQDITVDVNGQSNVKDIYLLLLPIRGNNNIYYSMELVKGSNDSYYSCYSNHFVTRHEKLAYDSGHHWTKIQDGDPAFILEHDSQLRYIEPSNVRSKIAGINFNDFVDERLFSRISLIKGNESISNALISFEDKKPKIFDKISYIFRSKIASILDSSSSKYDLKKQLPSLITSYYKSVPNNQNLKEFYMILAQSLFDINNRDKWLYDMLSYLIQHSNNTSINLDDYDFNYKVSKINNEESISIQFGIDKKKFSSNGSVPVIRFGSTYDSIYDSLVLMLEDISCMEITKPKDFYQLLGKLYTYYTLYSLIELSLLDTFKVDQNIDSDTIRKLRRKDFSSIYDRLFEIGFLKETDISDYPIVNLSSLDEIRDNYLKHKRIILSKEDNLCISNLVCGINNQDELFDILARDNSDGILFSAEIELLKEIIDKVKNNKKINSIMDKLKLIYLSRVDNDKALEYAKVLEKEIEETA